MQPLDGVEHRVLRHRHPGGPGQHRPQRLDHPALDREHPRHVPAERLRQRQQPQRLRRGSAVDDDHVPAATDRVVAQLEEGQHLLGARDHGQLLGGDRVDPGRVEHRHQVALDLAPGPLEPALGVDLLHPQPRLDLRRLGPDGAAPVPNASPSECAASVEMHQGPLPGARGERRRPGGGGGLADPALAGEQDDAHDGDARSASDSTRFFRPFSAVSMMTFSALRAACRSSGSTVDGQPVGHLGASPPAARSVVGALHRLEHLALDQVPARRTGRRASRRRACRSP